MRVVIIGAPRSGTNMLRDVLTALPGFATWPCDEINAVWRHGTLDYPYDDLDGSDATPDQRAFVQRAFDTISRRYSADAVIEKTCANSLRVDYVRALVPDARIVFIHRNGYDAVASAVKRWVSSVDLVYTLRKARFVPPSDLPHYGRRWLRNRWRQLANPQHHLSVWGPMTARVAEAAAAGDIPRAAARQWADCVSRTLDQLPADHIAVRYEAFVGDPLTQLERVTSEMGCSFSAGALESAVMGVRSDMVGRGAAVVDGRSDYANEIDTVMERLSSGHS